MPNALHIRPDDLAACRALHRAHGTSYFLASKAFPPDLREATDVLYAFFRVPDEMVDNPTSDPHAALTAWRAQWSSAYATGEAQHPVLRAAAAVFHAYQIPWEDGEAFLAAMQADLTVTRYATYADLQRYMYGSAEVVGVMMTRLMGVHDEATLRYARTLGEAMQLTNFLRDVGEDYRERRRIYLPLDACEQFGVTEDDIAAGRVTEEYRRLMGHFVAKARVLYAEATPGIARLPRRGRKAVRAAARLYAEILRAIEHRGYDTLNGRARVPLWRKFILALIA